MKIGGSTGRAEVKRMKTPLPFYRPLHYQVIAAIALGIVLESSARPRRRA